MPSCVASTAAAAPRTPTSHSEASSARATDAVGGGDSSAHTDHLREQNSCPTGPWTAPTHPLLYSDKVHSKAPAGRPGWAVAWGSPQCVQTFHLLRAAMRRMGLFPFPPYMASQALLRTAAQLSHHYMSEMLFLLK